MKLCMNVSMLINHTNLEALLLHVSQWFQCDTWPLASLVAPQTWRTSFCVVEVSLLQSSMWASAIYTFFSFITLIIIKINISGAGLWASQKWKVSEPPFWLAVSFLSDQMKGNLILQGWVVGLCVCSCFRAQFLNTGWTGWYFDRIDIAPRHAMY